MAVARDLADLLAEIHDRYPGDGVGIEFFGRFADALRLYEPGDVVGLQAKSYSAQYVRDFLLSSPGLLRAMTSRDWSRAFTVAGPRPALRPSDIEMDSQGDIYFVCKYLGLDAVEFSLDCAEIPVADKERILRKVGLSAPLLMLDDLEREDCDGVYFVAESVLRETTERLLAEGCWSRLPNTLDGIIERLARLASAAPSSSERG
jgi:hypothetical protein